LLAQDIGVATKISIDIATDDIEGDFTPARDANKYLYITTTYIYIPFRITHSLRWQKSQFTRPKTRLGISIPFQCETIQMTALF
jgi:hypothetical protein